MTTHTALANQRIYFVDGAAAGRSQRTDRPTLRLSPHCFPQRVLHDAAVALLAALLVVLAPAVVVWAA
jgi:hypothetical protein